MDASTIAVVIGVIFSGMGSAFVLKDYIASILAGIIIRRQRSGKHIKVGGRVKILTTPVIKGDILKVGPLRTTLMEVGDGERLPSVRTGRIVKVPNFMMINNPLLIYGDVITDEVVAYMSPPYKDPDKVVANMREVIEKQGHKVIEIGLYQKEDHLIVHGIFEVGTKEVADERTKILSAFLQKYSKTP